MRIVITSVLLFFTCLSYAQSIGWGVDEDYDVPIGLQVGDKAPDFSTENHAGRNTSLNELLRKGKVVLLFYRGQWCPVCNRYLSSFQDSVQLILNKGASVVAITPETSANAQKMISKTKMSFDVVPDLSGQIMNDYDVIFQVTKGYQNKIKMALSTDIAKNNGSEEAQLPVPATYIINQAGIIDYVHFDYNYKKRASVKDILENL